jgi:hypothetical protein
MRKETVLKTILFAGVFSAVAACSNNGCTGPKGDLGPTGPQGSQGAPAATATYYYNSGFDTQANLSEWTVYQSGGTGSISTFLDSSAFNSPGESMGVSATGSVFVDSLIYQVLSFDTSKDIWVEFDWLLQGLSGENEIVLRMNNVDKASIGYNGTNIFLTNSGTRYYPAPAISTSLWHHVKMKLTPSTGLSSYWIDGLSIGTNYSTAIVPTSSPNSGDLLGIKLNFTPGDKIRIDNVQCYRY